MPSPLANFIREAPPVSRTIAALTFTTSLLALVFNVIPPRSVIYHPYFIKKFPPQLWRLVSSFFLTGPKLGVIMDSFFLYRDGSECEKRFARPGDFLVFNVFVGAVILILNTWIVGGAVFCSALNVAYAYYWSSKEPAAANFTFVIATFSVRFLPYVMLLVLAVTRGFFAFQVGITGLIASHLYLFLAEIYPRYARTASIIQTPRWVHGLFEAAPAPPVAPIRTTTSATASGREPQGTGATWRARGSGQRLGS